MEAPLEVFRLFHILKDAFTSSANRRLLDVSAKGDVEALRKVLADGGVNLESSQSMTSLGWASFFGHTEVVQILVEAGADVNATNSNYDTPLTLACTAGHWAIAAILLQAQANPNMTNKRGMTPLSCARSNAETVQLLLESGADASARVRTRADVEKQTHDLRGWTPLYWTSNAAVARLLVAANADIHHTDKAGETPLHEACKFFRHGVATVLIEAGANPNAQTKRGFRPIHSALFAMWESGCWDESLHTLQVLLSHGVEWDDTCNAILDQTLTHVVRSTWRVPGPTEHDRWKKDAPAIRVCVSRWRQELTQDIPLTEIPIESVQGGLAATEIYIKEIATSRDVVFRRKICVVGPSNWGKTSLTKSLTTNKPSLVHPDDRTIGIDHFLLSFDEHLPGLNAIKKHEVTFWDFAGQDEYQVAHSLFFSQRTLYLVCIDLKAYAVTFLQALLMTDDTQMMDERMNWYIETRILRWIRLIFAYQPDAEFEFVGTKHDLIWEEPDNEALEDLRERLANVMVIVDGMKRAVEQSSLGDVSGARPTKKTLYGGQEQDTPVTSLEDKRLRLLTHKPSPSVIYSSCSRLGAVLAARDTTVRLILRSQRSYPMPDTFSRVLAAVEKKRVLAATRLADVRIREVFVDIDTLVDDLVRDINGISAVTCRSILETLRDLGDVLWYDKLHDDTLRRTVIIDPLLMIDLIRQVVDHRHKGEVIFHATLRALPLWRNLIGKQMLAMKRLLQHFQLVYPTDKEMEEGSDLLMPAFWRTKTSAQWLFLGQELKDGVGANPVDWRVRVHWDIYIEFGFQEAMFDRLVVASYSSAYHRHVGPDWIQYEDEQSADDARSDTAYAVRLVVDWHRETHKRVLHLEAVLGKHAYPIAETELWTRFEHLCSKLAMVLESLPGLVSTVSARDGRGGHPALRMCTKPASKWLPPEPILTSCRQLLTKRRVPH